jgi:hypothetical protein
MSVHGKGNLGTKLRSEVVADILSSIKSDAPSSMKGKYQRLEQRPRDLCDTEPER